MTTQSFATPSEVESFASELPDTYLLCREIGHTWRPWRATREPWGWDRTLRCQRCGAHRVQVLDHRGSIVRSSYVYGEGYLHKGLGRLAGETRDIVRLESVTRLAEQRMKPSVIDQTTEKGSDAPKRLRRVG